MQSEERRRKQSFRIDPSLRAGFKLNDVVVLPQNGTIIWHNKQKHLPPKAVEVLLFLCQNRNRLITTETLLSYGWGDTEANRSNLTHVISEIRNALDDHKECPAFIQTIPKKGYRLIAKISPKDETVLYTDRWKLDPSPSIGSHSHSKEPGLKYSLAILKNSKLFSVSMGFMIAIWFLIQVFDIVFPIFNVPDWGLKIAVLVLVVGLPLALLFTWLKEIKIKKQLASKSTSVADRKFFFRQLAVDFTFIGFISLMVGWLSFFLIESIEREAVISDEIFELTMTVPVQNDLLAVLPFKFQTQSSLPNYIKGTFQSEFIQALSNQGYFKLVSARAINELNEDFTMSDVLKRLGARYILDGQVVDNGQKVTVIINLIDTQSFMATWNSQVQGELDTFLNVQKEVYRQTVNALAMVAEQPKTEFLFINTNDFKAYDSYIQGKNILNNAMSDKSLELAEKHFLSALEQDPQFTQALAGLCQSYLDRYEQSMDISSFDLAKQYCASLSGNEQLKSEGFVALGNLNRLSGNHEQAIDNYQSALNINEDALDAVRGLAKSKLAVNEDQEAEDIYRQLISKEPGYWRNYVDYGYYLFTVGKYQAASKQFEKAILLRPNEAVVINGLGAAYYMNLEWENAAKALERSIQIAPNAETYSNLGTALFFTADYEAAISNYKAATQLNSDNPIIWANLGDAQKYAGHLNQAKATYSKAYDLVTKHLELNPNDLVLLGISIRVESELGLCTQVQERVAILSNQDKSDPYLFYDLSLASLTCGFSSQAITLMQRARALGYPDSLLKQDVQFETVINQILEHSVIHKI
jgi:tetratricopeptide (TPR) repeat protein/DNA-binding winged helix-turn-helix (wHTH) protein